MKQNYALLILLLICTLPGVAQSKKDEPPEVGYTGYIIRGGERYSGGKLFYDHHEPEKVYYQALPYEDPKKFEPYQVEEFGFSDGKYGTYESHILLLEGKAVPLFTQVVEDGVYRLHQVLYKGEPHYYLQKNGEGLLEITDESVKSIFVEAAGGDEGWVSQIDYITLRTPNLKQMTERLNEGSFEPISLFSFGMYITPAFSKYSINTTVVEITHTYLIYDYKPFAFFQEEVDQSVVFSSPSVKVGGFVDFPIRKLTNTFLRLQADWSAISITDDVPLESDEFAQTLDINYSLVNVGLIGKFLIGDMKLNGVIVGGPLAYTTFGMESNFYEIQYESPTNPDRVLRHDEDFFIMPSITDGDRKTAGFGVGFTFGLGVRYHLSNGMYLEPLLTYDYLRERFSTVNSYGLQLNVGIQ